MSNQAFRHYQRTQMETASPGELILMLYGGAIRFLTVARHRLDARDLEGANRSLLRAQEIVLELMISVDVAAGPVGRNLFDLYEYMHGQLVQANVRKDVETVDAVIAMLRDLLSAWEQAIAAAATSTEGRVVPIRAPRPPSADGAPPVMQFATA